MAFLGIQSITGQDLWGMKKFIFVEISLFILHYYFLQILQFQVAKQGATEIKECYGLFLLF